VRVAAGQRWVDDGHFKIAEKTRRRSAREWKAISAAKTRTATPARMKMGTGFFLGDYL